MVCIDPADLWLSLTSKQNLPGPKDGPAATKPHDTNHAYPESGSAATKTQIKWAVAATDSLIGSY